MAITNIHTGQSFSSFIQPNINDNVNVRLDVQIAWINEGYYVHIPNGGIYEVVSKVVFNYVFKLIKPYANAGDSVSMDVIYPIPREVIDVINDEVISTEKTVSTQKFLEILRDWGISNYANRLNIRTPLI